jgi:hypothetical protein
MSVSVDMPSYESEYVIIVLWWPEFCVGNKVEVVLLSDLKLFVIQMSLLWVVNAS